jgi:hypothetical protein
MKNKYLPIDDALWVTAEEGADLFGLPLHYIYHARREGWIRFQKSKHRLYFLQGELRRLSNEIERLKELGYLK